MSANTGRFQLSGTAFAHICLPIKAKEGFHHAYVSYLLPELCLVLVSATEDCFESLHSCQDVVLTNLTQSGLLAELDEAITTPAFSIRRDLVPAGVVTHELWHFMFKMTGRCQVAYPTFEGIYANTIGDAGESAAEELFRAYQKLHARMHDHSYTGSGGGAGTEGQRERSLQPGKARACFYVTPVHSIFSYLTSVRAPVQTELALAAADLTAQTAIRPCFYCAATGVRVLRCVFAVGGEGSGDGDLHSPCKRLAPSRARQALPPPHAYILTHRAAAHLLVYSALPECTPATCMAEGTWQDATEGVRYTPGSGSGWAAS